MVRVIREPQFDEHNLRLGRSQRFELYPQSRWQPMSLFATSIKVASASGSSASPSSAFLSDPQPRTHKTAESSMDV
jgi:hypothetical protein